MIEKKQSLQKAYIPKAVLKENFNSGRTTGISPSGMDGMLMLEGKSPTRTRNRTDTILLNEAFPIANKQHSILKSNAAADLMEQPNWKNEMDVGQTEHRAKRVQIPAFNNLSASLIDDNFFINRKRFIKGYREDSFSASEEQRDETSSELSLLDGFNAFQKQVVRRLPSLKDDHLTAKKHRQRRYVNLPRTDLTCQASKAPQTFDSSLS